MMTDKTKLVKEAKKKQIVVAGPPIKKRLGEMGLSEMKLGKMRLGEMWLGEMLTNHTGMPYPAGRWIRWAAGDCFKRMII